MRNDKRKANLGKKYNGGNGAMIRRAKKFRVGDVVRMSPRANRGPDSIYEWLNGRLGVVTETHPYMWDVIANFSFVVHSHVTKKLHHYNRDFGFWDFDLELVKR